MSRWRRQQRKRALRRHLADRAALFAEIRAAVVEYCRRRLKEPIGNPAAIESHYANWLEGWFPKPIFDVKARLNGKSITVDVTVRRPPPGLAAALIEAGGKWV